MNPWRRLRTWWRSPERRLRRRAAAELRRLFHERRPLLATTSLRPEHLGRTQLLAVEAEPFRIRFGIVRHPRPHPFSRQVHQVLEIWTYDVTAMRLTREQGINLTRRRGEDGDPSDTGIGI